MAKLKIYIASAVFILLTFTKLFSPAVVSALKARLLPAAEPDYIEALTALGRGLTELDGNVIQALSPPRGEAAAVEALSVRGLDYSPVTLAELRLDRSLFLCPSALPVKEAAVAAESIPEEPPVEAVAAPEEAVSVPEETPAVVATFLASQSEYSELALPANVSYTMPALPFAYTAPTAGAASGFGYRLHPIQAEVKFHYGTDIAGNSGEEVYAFADGVVTAAGESESYGLYLMISHAEGYGTLYAHCSRLIALEGQSVSCGALIALVGQTGLATGPHLHFELTQNGVYLNPEFYLGTI